MEGRPGQSGGVGDDAYLFIFGFYCVGIDFIDDLYSIVL